MKTLNNNSANTDSDANHQREAQPLAGEQPSRLVTRGETNLEKPYKYRVHDGWAELLARYPWEWFVNLTFTEMVHPESALKSYKTWISILNTLICP